MIKEMQIQQVLNVYLLGSGVSEQNRLCYHWVYSLPRQADVEDYTQVWLSNY